jgi:hypothetical protein
VATEGAYYFVMGDRRRADIVKCRALQPTIRDHSNYAAYLWVNAYQGYFLLRQRFIDNQVTEWRVIAEVNVSDPDYHFFEQHGDQLLEQLEAAESAP